ncbi:MULTISPECIES: hypothetical protein [unclassified Blastococcus]
MSEPDSTPQTDGSDEDGSHASVGGDVSSAGGGRTEGETSVDEAMGQEPPAAG